MFISFDSIANSRWRLQFVSMKAFDFSLYIKNINRGSLRKKNRDNKKLDREICTFLWNIQNDFVPVFKCYAKKGRIKASEIFITFKYCCLIWLKHKIHMQFTAIHPYLTSPSYPNYKEMRSMKSLYRNPLYLSCSVL